MDILTSLIRTKRRRIPSNVLLTANRTRLFRTLIRYILNFLTTTTRITTRRSKDRILAFPIDNLAGESRNKRGDVVKTRLSKSGVNAFSMVCGLKMVMLTTKRNIRLNRNTNLSRLRRVLTRRTKRTRVSNVVPIRIRTFTRLARVTNLKMALRIRKGIRTRRIVYVLGNDRTSANTSTITRNGVNSKIKLLLFFNTTKNRRAILLLYDNLFDNRDKIYTLFQNNYGNQGTRSERRRNNQGNRTGRFLFRNIIAGPFRYMLFYLVVTKDSLFFRLTVVGFDNRYRKRFKSSLMPRKLSVFKRLLGTRLTRFLSSLLTLNNKGHEIGRRVSGERTTLRVVLINTTRRETLVRNKVLTSRVFSRKKRRLRTVIASSRPLSPTIRVSGTILIRVTSIANVRPSPTVYVNTRSNNNLNELIMMALRGTKTKSTRLTPLTSKRLHINTQLGNKRRHTSR